MANSYADFAENFNSRPREGADEKHIHIVCKSKFQLTAPRGGRRKFCHFCRYSCRISTHGPARGPTFVDLLRSEFHIISTHGPARGPTQKRLRHGRQTEFQLTAPRGGRQVASMVPTFSFNFNSRPREGADHFYNYIQSSGAISTHGPARGPTQSLQKRLPKKLFQLTAPRGGRRLSCL